MADFGPTDNNLLVRLYALVLQILHDTHLVHDVMKALLGLMDSGKLKDIEAENAKLAQKLDIVRQQKAEEASTLYIGHRGTDL